MINRIWNVLLIVGIIVSIFTGNIDSMGKIIMNSANEAFQIFFNVALVILFWGGIFNIAIESGLIKNLTRIFASNIIANLLGLGSAATPLGLKAFSELQKKNENKDKPSRSMITFILMNVSSLTLFPTTILGIRAMYHGTNEPSLLVLMIIGTTVSATMAIILDRLFYMIEKRRARK